MTRYPFRQTISPELVIHDFSDRVAPEIEDERVDLLRAALAIARIEYLDLDPDPYIRKVAGFAERVLHRLSSARDSMETVLALNYVLFSEEGFRGNNHEYYDASNSFLNQVIDRKLGIPITLSVLYMEVAIRAGLPLVGVAMPGHFLVKHYDAEGSEMLIDVFEQGKLITVEDCQRRLNSTYSNKVPMQPDFLAPANKRQILARMLNNLRQIYLDARNFRKALTIVDLILAIYPRSPEDVKQRAILRYETGQLRPGLNDFETYLKMLPEAPDAEEIRSLVIAIRRKLATFN